MSQSVARDVEAGHINRSKLIRLLKDVGAGIVLGTDDPDPLLVSGFCVHQELRNLVDAGLTPYEAIKAGTCDAADCLGAADEFGTLTPGRRADLVMLEQNPLVDVANAAKIAGVMVRGRWLPQAELQAMLDTLEEKLARDQISGSG
jgi:imidazolonepropionase-like amidohydrolase